MTSGADWQARVGQNWAAMWRQTDRSFAGLTARLLERIERSPAEVVLDIGCGAGEVSLALARARPAARVTGIDLSSDLVAVARERAVERPNVRFVEADASAFAPDEAPQLLVSRHGVMFFPEPVPAFAHLHQLAAPSANLLFSCFRDRRLNPWATELAALLPPEFVTPADPLAPGPFAFADEARIYRILSEAGWQDIRCEAVDYSYVAGMGEDPLAEAVAFLSSIGPAAAAIEAMRGTAAEPVFHERLMQWLADYASPGMVAFPAAAWVVTACRD